MICWFVWRTRKVCLVHASTKYTDRLGLDEKEVADANYLKRASANLLQQFYCYIVSARRWGCHQTGAVGDLEKNLPAATSRLLRVSYRRWAAKGYRALSDVSCDLACDLGFVPWKPGIFPAIRAPRPLRKPRAANIARESNRSKKSWIAINKQNASSSGLDADLTQRQTGTIDNGLRRHTIKTTKEINYKEAQTEQLRIFVQKRRLTTTATFTPLARHNAGNTGAPAAGAVGWPFAVFETPVRASVCARRQQQ